MPAAMRHRLLDESRLEWTEKHEDVFRNLFHFNFIKLMVRYMPFPCNFTHSMPS